MEPRRRSFITGAALGITGVILVALAYALVVVYTGSYNIAATEDHTPTVRWAFTTTMRNSVKARASDIIAPESFTAATIEQGASKYKAMCQHCHGGLGIHHEDWAEGMLPQPPHLPDVANEWETHEVFWLVKHGLKMTGMPAFGPTHSDEDLWSLAAFVSELPGMTSEEYSSLGGNASASGGQGHSH